MLAETQSDKGVIVDAHREGGQAADMSGRDRPDATLEARSHYAYFKLARIVSQRALECLPYRGLARQCVLYDAALSHGDAAELLFEGSDGIQGLSWAWTFS